jgi:hypothetical protein
MPLAAAAPAEPDAGFFMIANTLYPVLGTKVFAIMFPR